MIKTLLIVLVSTFLYSKEFHLNEKITNFSLLNQFDQKQTIDNNVTIILVSFEKEISRDVNDYLAQQEKDFLKNHNAVFVSNISKIPTIITKLFLLPQMRDYAHSILLMYDETDNRFRKKEGKLTLYGLENGVLKSISFVTTDDLEEVFH